MYVYLYILIYKDVRMYLYVSGLPPTHVCTIMLLNYNSTFEAHCKSFVHRII